MSITLSVDLFLTVMLTSLRKLLSTIHHTSIYSIKYLVFSQLNHSYSLVYTSYSYLVCIIKEYNLSITDLVTRIILTVNPLLTESGTLSLTIHLIYQTFFHVVEFIHIEGLKDFMTKEIILLQSR